MSATPDYYKTLGVSRDASADEIKKAFRKLARKYHPAAGGDEAKFTEINEESEVISDDKKRKLYDQYGTANENQIPFGGGQYTGGNPFAGASGFGGASGFSSWADILESLRNGEGAFGTEWNFGGQGRQQYQPRPQRGTDKTVTLTVTFKEAFDGCDKRIRVGRSGQNEKETLSIKIPAGAVEGGRVRLKGKGGPGVNGGPDGDLLVKVHIAEDPVFSRKKADVLMTLPVTFAEAVLGTQVVIPTPSGKRVRLKVPAGTQEGTVLTVRGQGAPRVGKNAYGTGDLLVTVEIKVPKHVNEAQRKALEAFQEATTEEVRTW